MPAPADSPAPLLFLAHRMPFPPTKGDKVRSYHFFRHLAARHRVFLGTFVDDAADLQHLGEVERLCAEVHVERLDPRTALARSAIAFGSGDAISVRYFRSRRLRAWVDDVVARHEIRTAFAYSSPMAQYVLPVRGLRRIVDFVDLDSAKWKSYAQQHRWPASVFYAREARRLLAFERKVAATVEATLFVTRQEAAMLCAAAPDCASRIASIDNGVDSHYFSPEHALASPFPRGERPIVFTGAMDYWPNVDAVVWFAREVLPRLRESDARVRFHIVGMRPNAAVRALASPSIDVTGRVGDVRPYLRHASVVVAPLRVARGIQNKVLEAMAMARPVVTTSATAAALAARPGRELDVADSATAFADAVRALMEPVRGDAMGRAARDRVLADFQWSARLARLDALLAGDGPRRVASAAEPPPRDLFTATSTR